MNILKKWMDAATEDERETLALRAKTSVNYLYQIAGNHRDAAAGLAGRIEIAAAEIRGRKKRLPRITRADLATACASCPYARKCIKKG